MTSLIPTRNSATGELVYIEIPQDDLYFARRLGEPDNTAMAARVARRLLEPWRHGRKIGLCILGDRRRPPEFHYDSRRMNMYVAIFQRSDESAAEQWIINALMLGYTVFALKKASCGRGLKDGDCSDDLPPEVFAGRTWSMPLPEWALPTNGGTPA